MGAQRFELRSQGPQSCKMIQATLQPHKVGSDGQIILFHYFIISTITCIHDDSVALGQS